jgi:transposase
MHFVAIKTPEQSDLLSLHRVRSRLVRQRTAIVNQIRDFLIERGITVRQGPRPLRKVLPEVSSSPPEALSPRILRLIAELDEDWRRPDERIEAVSAEIENLSEKDAACQRLMTVPGIGPIISSAVVAAIGTGSGFKHGRDFAAWLGLVPKQESTGDRTKLGRISKRGNKYLRTLFVQAAHVVIERRPAAAMRALWPWIHRASKRLVHRNLLARQQACTHRLGGARPWPRLRAKDHPQCRITSACSGSPREWTPSLSATLARQSSWIGQASDGGSEGMASPDPR